jgi:hypothetical protein
VIEREKLRSSSGTRGNGRSATHAIARAFLSDALKERADLVGLLAEDKSGEGLADKIDSLNGFLSMILDLDNATFLAVDRVRSSPQFHSVTDSKTLVSDDARLILKDIGAGNASRLPASFSRSVLPSSCS